LKTKQAVLHFKDTMKEHLNCNMIQPYHFDYNFTIDGMQHFQNFMAKQNEHSSLYNLRSTSRELPCMRLSIRMNGTSCIDSPCAWLYKTLLQKNRKVLVHFRSKESFKSYLSKIHPLVKQMERGRMNVVTCGSCAVNLKMENASQRDDAASALLTLAHSDSSSYTSDGSSAYCSYSSINP
jgi:hypothetical protein